MGSQTTETVTSTIPGAAGGAMDARQLLLAMGQGAAGQMGDLGALANGQLQITPEDEALIRRISELTSESARANIQDNAAFASAQLEDRTLAKGIAGSTIEAVDEAMIGRQMQQSLDTEALKNEITSAEQLRKQSLDRAGVQLSSNQLLMQQLLGGAGGFAQMDLQERLNQGTTTGVTETDAVGNAAAMLGSAAGQVGAAYAGKA